LEPTTSNFTEIRPLVAAPPIHGNGRTWRSWKALFGNYANALNRLLSMHYANIENVS